MQAFKKLDTDLFISRTRPLISHDSDFLINMRANLDRLLGEDTGMTPIMDTILKLGWMQEIDCITRELTLRN